MFFGCTVVSTMTREGSEGFMAPVLVAPARLSCNSACSRSSPMRLRQLVIEERSSGSRCWKNYLPEPRAITGRANNFGQDFTVLFHIAQSLKQKVDFVRAKIAASRNSATK